MPSLRQLRYAIVILAFSAGRTGLAADPVGEVPPPIGVEGQPLAANIRRVITAMEMSGTPFDRPLLETLSPVVDAREAVRMQEILDSQVAFILQINPEERAKVRRGPAKVSLQQHGFTPVLVKILNESTATKRIRMVSPQSGAVYAGVAKLSMQRQRSMELIENENSKGDRERFVAVEMFDSPPMSDRLSGLEVEYAIGLILSTEAGRREITIGFDLGQGEQDLGFRGEVAALFDVRPAVPIRLSVHDEQGATTGALIIRDARGYVYPLQAKRLAPDFFFQPHIYRADGETVLLPPGKFTVQSGRGPEYWVREQPISVTALAVPDQSDRKERHANREISSGIEQKLDVRLERWVNPAQYGFYSGDHHIHAAGCAHYTHPTEGVTPQDMFRQVKGEGLNVGCVLTWGPCFRHQRQFFEAKPLNISEPFTVLKYDLEISGFGSQSLGHVCLLNLQDQTYPGSDGLENKGWPTWTTPVMRWAKAQGGYTGYAHSASGLAIEPAAATKRMIAKFDKDNDGRISASEAKPTLLPEVFAKIDADRDQTLDDAELIGSHQRVADRLPNLAVPEMNGVGAMEICVTTAEGVCDFISAMDTRRIQEWNTWYHLLNCGFPLKVSGETDFPCMSSRRVGQGRVYVKLHEALADAALNKPTRLPIEGVDFATWCQGLAGGRSYVSDGFAHALDFRVNGVSPGDGRVNLASAGKALVTAKVAFAPETPTTVAQGTLVPSAGLSLIGDTVDLHGPRSEQVGRGGERLIEIVVNGRAVASQKVPADGKVHELKFEIPIERSSWVALRHFPQLHTNPVDVIVGGKAIRASRLSARWCEETIELLWTNRKKAIAANEQEEARKTFDRAIGKYRAIAEECELD